MPAPAGSGPPSNHPTRLRGAEAVRLHLTLVVGLMVCIAAFCFELLRALGGHTFSWLYVFEWPIFAGFALYMWWNLFNGNDRHRAAAADSSEESSGKRTESRPEDEGLAAWKRYLAAMEAAEAEDDGSDRPDPGRGWGPRRSAVRRGDDRGASDHSADRPLQRGGHTAL